MSALQRLQEKIEQWRVKYEELKSENGELKIKLNDVANYKTEQSELIAGLEQEVEQCIMQEDTINELRKELSDKDAEIEKIISQVESLLA